MTPELFTASLPYALEGFGITLLVMCALIGIVYAMGGIFSSIAKRKAKKEAEQNENQ